MDKNLDQIRLDFPAGAFKDPDVFLVQQDAATKGATFQELRDGLSYKGVFSIKSVSGLSFSLWGGDFAAFNGDTIGLSDSTLTLADNATNYIEVLKTTGEVSSNTLSFTIGTRSELYKVVTVSGAVTSIIDCRQKLTDQTKTSLLPTGTEYSEYVSGDRRKVWLEGFSPTDSRRSTDACATDIVQITPSGWTTTPRKYPEPLSLNWLSHPSRNPSSPGVYQVLVTGGKLVLADGSEVTKSDQTLSLTEDVSNFIAIERASGNFVVGLTAYSNDTHYNIYEVIPDSTPASADLCFSVIDLRKTFLRSPVRNFLDLTDTPFLYSGKAGYVATVNNAEDGLEFKDVRQMITAKLFNTAGLSSSDYVDVFVDYACEILKVTMISPSTGSCVVDIYNTSYSGYPTDLNATNSITASAKPTISSSDKYQDDTLTGWSVSVSPNSFLRFKVDSATDLDELSIFLTVRKKV